MSREHQKLKIKHSKTNRWIYFAIKSLLDKWTISRQTLMDWKFFFFVCNVLLGNLETIWKTEQK